MNGSGADMLFVPAAVIVQGLRRFGLKLSTLNDQEKPVAHRRLHHRELAA